jgi:uncharacterized protein (TIGR04442 family)
MTATTAVPNRESSKVAREREGSSPAPVLKMVKRTEGGAAAQPPEAAHTAEARRILDGFVLNPANRKRFLGNELLIGFIRAYKQGRESGDQEFTRLLLNAGLFCDEWLKGGGDGALAVRFASLQGYLESFDDVAGVINALAFLPGWRLAAEALELVVSGEQHFESLLAGFFAELFLAGPLASGLLGRFGRRKLEALAAGLARQADRAELGTEIRRLEDEERLFGTLLALVRPLVAEEYAFYAGAEREEMLKRLVTIELRQRNELAGEIPPRLFAAAMLQAGQEAVYRSSVLPLVLAGAGQLREEFLAETGIDRLDLEQLEEDGCEAASDQD